MGAQGTTVPATRTAIPPGRSRLTREQVAAAALGLLDRDGFDSLSMRRLADELGIGTMTLYGYFASKRELLDAVMDAALADGPPPEPRGDWREQLSALLLRARESLVRHPGLIQIRVRQPVLRPEALRFAESGLEILERAGFDPQEAAYSFRLLFTYSFGFAAFSPADTVDEDRAAARSAIATLPPDEYPRLTAAAEEAAGAMGGEPAFAYGLERILDGLEARLAAGG